MSHVHTSGRIFITGAGREASRFEVEFVPGPSGVNVFVSLAPHIGTPMNFEVHMSDEGFLQLLDELRASTTPEILLSERTAPILGPQESTKPEMRLPEDTIPDAPALSLGNTPGSVDIQIPIKPPILMRIAGGDGHARFIADAIFSRVKAWGGKVDESFYPK